MLDVTFDIVTTTDFTEYGKDVFAAVIDGLHFELKLDEMLNRILLSMGTGNNINADKKALDNLFRGSPLLSEVSADFHDHFVSVPILVDGDWLNRLKNCVEICVLWAKNNQIQSGCFLCGKADGSVFLRDTGEKNTYICDSCVESRREDTNLQKIETEYRSSIPLREERFVFGLLISFAMRAVLSILLVAVISNIYTSYLLSEHPEKEFASDFQIYIIAGFAITFLMMRLYKKAAGSLGVIGILLTGGLSAITFFLDFMIFFPLALRQASNIQGVEIPSSYFEILLNLNVYLNRLSLGKVQFAIIAPFFLGIIAAVVFDYLRHKIEYS